MRPLTLPTDAELGLLLAAKYESHGHSQGWVLRRFNSVRGLTAVASLIFGYDVLSVFLFR